MDRQLALFCAGPDLFKHRQRSARAAGEVGRVLNLDEAGRGAQRSTRMDDRLDVLPGENAAPGGNGAHQTAGKDGGRRHLPVQNVRAGLRNHLLPRLRERADRDLVAHGSRGHKQRRLAAKDLRRAPLKQVQSWVFAINVVANFSRGHGCAHLLAGPRYGIGT